MSARPTSRRSTPPRGTCGRPRDAYQFQNITAAYLASGVIPPPTAYGHIAMYPPFNLAPIVPITLLPMGSGNLALVHRGIDRDRLGLHRSGTNCW